MLLIVAVILAMGFLTAPISAIDCFKCVSMNGSNPACDDTFHNNYSVDFLEKPCMGGRKNRDGLFPATACIKITGQFDDSLDTITIRGCALDSGSLTTDTEIVRMSHCGRFFYDNRYVRGCLQSCKDSDGCNSVRVPRFRNDSDWLTVICCVLVVVANFWTDYYFGFTSDSLILRT